MKVCADQLCWNGRYLDNNGIRYFDYSASGFSFVLKGKRAVTTIFSDCDKWDDISKAFIGVFVSDGEGDYWSDFPDSPTFIYELKDKVNECLLFESECERTVTIRVVKLSEAEYAYVGFGGLDVEGEVFPVKSCSSPKIEFIGDSITCGYGVDGKWAADSFFTTKTQRADKAYAFLTAKNLKSEFQCCSWSGKGIISDYVDPPTAIVPKTVYLMPSVWPYSDRELSERMGIEPEVWDESKFSPDIVVIHLGTNDASWVQNKEDRRIAFVSGYCQLIEAVHRRSPNAKICCCLGVMGQDLCESVEEAVKMFNKVFPSVLTKVVKFPVQDEKDGIGIDWHPSAVTQRKIALKLTEELKNW